MCVESKLAFCDFIEVNDWKEEFDELVDECYPSVELFGTKYPISRAIKLVDHTKYEVLVKEYINNCYDDYINGDYDLDVEY